MSWNISSALEDIWDMIPLESTIDELRGVAVQITRNLGFQWFAYLRISGGNTELVSSYPDSLAQLYVRDKLSDVDPIVRHARTARMPFFWGDLAEDSCRLTPDDRFTQEVARHGIRNGLAVPVYVGYSKFAAMIFAEKTADRPTRSEIQTALAAIHLTAFQLHARFTMSSSRHNSAAGRPLTFRQRQCLTWSARGKTMSETGTILGISERTVLYHLQDARLRLGAQTITQAVVEAMRFNQISDV
ncbi:helix-turn-helix transcriptional regulator [Bradyrhizobium sp. CCBAU 45394]|uniref:helix-turn-helix transcriptional regulator n=1 Tax=Bradyrhizobium sp. CCBAU 45394 TaxID=1325087 RepID=UPI002303BF43|nr:LuxR family transcriptional regulator [Bradyrhizobium sp. CCBAU 45394]